MARAKLFANIRRTDVAPARYAETHYGYMARTARPEFECVRTVLEAWFQEYPAAHSPELRARIRSGNDRHFLSATFELYIHAMLKRTGAHLHVHPKVPRSSGRPDFLVTPPQGDSYYVEATLATDLSDAQAAAEARISTVYDTINRLGSPNFYIGVRHRGAPASPVPGAAIRRFLKARLAELNPSDFDHWTYGSGGFDSLPHWPFSHDGWEVEFFPIPKPLEIRGSEETRPLAMFMPREASWVDSRTPIRDAISNKAGRYGDLDHPFVIAANVFVWSVNRMTAMEALFGREQWIATSEGLADEPRMARFPDGVWLSHSGPRNQRVSAVMLCERLYPWSVAASNLCVYNNPWSTRPLQGQLDFFPNAKPEGDMMQWHDGSHPRELLGLRAGWPEQPS